MVRIGLGLEFGIGLGFGVLFIRDWVRAMARVRVKGKARDWIRFSYRDRLGFG